MFVRTIRVDPKNITPEMAHTPLEQLGKVSVEEVEFEKIRVKPSANREYKPKKPNAASLRSSAWKEASIRLIQEHQPCTARQVWEGLCKEEHNICLVTVQQYLKARTDAKELAMVQREERNNGGRRIQVNYYALSQGFLTCPR